jgi:hypothetical protein
MQQGELIVTGRDKAQISLHKFPSKVEVWFKEELEPIPCNPHHHDSLEWEVHRTNTNHSGYVLVIKWHVSGVREIKWTSR